MMQAASLQTLFDAAPQELPDWLQKRHADAVAAFRAMGIPHRRIEDWKYTDLRATLEAANDPGVGMLAWSVTTPAQGTELFDLAGLANAPDWVREHFGRSAADAAMPAASLAFSRSGFALRVAKGIQPAQPVNVNFSGTGHARALIVVEEGASATLVETPASGGFSNLGVEIVVGSGARLTLVRLADRAPSAIQVEDIAVRVARDATFHAHLVNGGALLARTTLRLTLKESGANALLSGVTVVGGALHADVTTEMYHHSGDTRSNQLFKLAAGGTAHAVYQGKITVAKGADRSDSRQTAKAILFSDRAEADLKPELEILADDVKCAHGAAIGDLDADSMFYLRSRGVPEGEARNLLIRAFLEDAVLPIADEHLRGAAWERVEALLPALLDTAS